MPKLTESELQRFSPVHKRKPCPSRPTRWPCARRCVRVWRCLAIVASGDPDPVAGSYEPAHLLT